MLNIVPLRAGTVKSAEMGIHVPSTCAVSNLDVPGKTSKTKPSQHMSPSPMIMVREMPKKSKCVSIHTCFNKHNYIWLYKM